MNTTSPPALLAPAPPAAAAPALDWPVPHHMRVVDPRAGAEFERCLATLADGTKLRGTIRQIDFDAGTLELATIAQGSRSLKLSALRSLFLTRSIELELIPLALPPGLAQGRATIGCGAYEFVFKDGGALRADVVALLPRTQGLFLFVRNYGDAVLRWFIPAEALASYRVHAVDGGRERPAAAVELSSQPPGERVAAGPVEREAFEAAEAAEDHAARTTREAVERALVHHHQLQARLTLGELLVRDGLVTSEQRDQALLAQRVNPRRLLGEILVDMGAVTPTDVRRVLIQQLGVPFVSLARFQCDPNAIKAVSTELARKHLALPLYRTEHRVVVAIDNPLSWEALRELEFFSQLKVDPVLAERSELLAAIDQYYGGAPPPSDVAQILAKLSEEEAGAQPATPLEPVTESDSTLVRLVNKAIQDAFNQGASDIHIESRHGDKPSRVRFRIDGVLVPYIEIPPNFRAALISRIKIMSELDISEHRKPQDGKITFEEPGSRAFELRVVIMPTVNGLEDAVLRILAPPRALSIDQLGLSPRDLLEVRAIASRSFGLLLVCGPTGSGKTTTLHSLLSSINTSELKIWTVEDPVEISQDGLCQVQVNAKLGLTFPNVLRSFLRADPDVIMVGEIRDIETARTVIAASLTGHLVFSTMHTNSAVESIVRLLDFGLDPFNFSDALLGVLGQRLVRRLCPACRQPYVASSEEIDALAHEYCRDSTQDPQALIAHWRARYGKSDGTIALNAPAGCPECDRSGYKGRLGVYELMLSSPALKARIRSRDAASDLLREALAAGMATLQQDAIGKVLEGDLDLKQVQLSCL